MKHSFALFPSLLLITMLFLPGWASAVLVPVETRGVQIYTLGYYAASLVLVAGADGAGLAAVENRL